VATTCSTKSADTLKSIGADATIDYKKPEEEQIAELLSVTDGKATRIFDAVAVNESFAKAVFKKVDGEKYFSTTNDWSQLPVEEFSGASISPVQLGPVGRPEATGLNANLSSFIPVMVSLIESGKVVPAEYEIIGSTGFESVLEAYAYQGAGKGGNKKVLVKLQDE